jgi:LacI family transcriptional regulator
LLSLGCKRIAIIADNPAIWTAAERIEGFKKAIVTRKLDSDNSLIISGIHTSNEAEQATRELLNQRKKIDGIIAANDLIAFGVGQVKSHLNSNLHVVSFDEFPSAALMGVHTLNHDPQRLGRLTADVIMKRMTEPTADNHQTAVMKVSMSEEIQGVA